MGYTVRGRWQAGSPVRQFLIFDVDDKVLCGGSRVMVNGLDSMWQFSILLAPKST